MARELGAQANAVVGRPWSRKCSARSGLNDSKPQESRPSAVPSATRAIVTSGSSSPDPRSSSATSASRCAWTSSPRAHGLSPASRWRKLRSDRDRRGRRGYGAHCVACRLLWTKRCSWRTGVSSAGHAYRRLRLRLLPPGTLRRSQGLCSEAANVPDERWQAGRRSVTLLTRAGTGTGSEFHEIIQETGTAFWAGSGLSDPKARRPLARIASRGLQAETVVEVNSALGRANV
jgi:hypothetical protein